MFQTKDLKAEREDLDGKIQELKRLADAQIRDNNNNSLQVAALKSSLKALQDERWLFVSDFVFLFWGFFPSNFYSRKLFCCLGKFTSSLFFTIAEMLWKMPWILWKKNYLFKWVETWCSLWRLSWRCCKKKKLCCRNKSKLWQPRYKKIFSLFCFSDYWKFVWHLLLWVFNFLQLADLTVVVDDLNDTQDNKVTSLIFDFNRFHSFFSTNLTCNLCLYFTLKSSCTKTNKNNWP